MIHSMDSRTCGLVGLALVCLALGGCRDTRTAGPGASDATAVLETITTPSGVEMVRIPAGEFLMGSDDADDERPAHRVRLGAFYMDTREVTQQVYQSVTGKNPAKFEGPDRPVDRVGWHAAVQYCNMRSLLEGLTPCYDAQTLQCDSAAGGYRLPTEAEWEYACRAGTTTRYSFGDSPGKLAGHAWFKENSAQSTREVGQRDPNGWGLYDMHGNVAEWCNDMYGEDYYQNSPAENPRGPDSSEERVLRGGSWKNSPESCRSSARYAETPGLADVCFGYEAYGFRCVRTSGDGEDAPENPDRGN